MIHPDTLPLLHPGDWTVIHQDEAQQWIASDEAEEVRLYLDNASIWLGDGRRIANLVIPFHEAKFAGSLDITHQGQGLCFTYLGDYVPLPVALYILEKAGWNVVRDGNSLQITEKMTTGIPVVYQFNDANLIK